MKELKRFCNQCPGSIYIDMIHNISEFVCDCGELYEATQKLWNELNNGKHSMIYVSVNEEKCTVSDCNILIHPDVIYIITGTKEDNKYWYDQYSINQIKKGEN